ncbi:cytochrome bc1 complex cytochrome b subunit [Actinocorallia populi]|uniref:cytochrome bc1 complex cytochrome b subunit n=1 Tax=Actinocorallia populi TaxID=2079200 RepID=UPI000D08DDEA|nr:cytochrome b N-terminal domain-containing protein [Actinocorallia populi]
MGRAVEDGEKRAGGLAAAGRAVDDRLGAAGFLKRNIGKAFPDHWTFLLGELALYSFLVLVATGMFLMLFFKPSMGEVVYDGSYAPLRGVRMSEAFASTVRLSLDVRGGLLLRQIHHWAALVFLASICVHLLRVFFTGAFRRPREVNWLIGVTMFVLAIAEGFAGYSLPDDLLSGTGLRIMQGIVLSIPVAGTYLSFFVFGGEFPGEDFIPRLFTVHILLLPGLLLALVTFHLSIVWHQKHTQWPGPGGSERKVSGDPTYPVFLAKTVALLLFTVAVLAGLGAFAQINPVWLYGPYEPSQVSSYAQPDWYVGFLEGALRIMPPWSTTAAGHTIAWNVLVPAVLLPGAFFTLLALYPFFERWAVGDWRVHNLLDRPRNAATRTAIGAAVIAWYGNLWAAGGDDVLSTYFHIPVEWLVWFFRAGFFLLPLLAFTVTRRLCLSLQRRDLRTFEEGYETCVLTGTPEGEYVALHAKADEEQMAALEPRHPKELEASAPGLFPLPTPDRFKARVRSRANRFYVDYQNEVIGGGQGRGSGGGIPE